MSKEQTLGTCETCQYPDHCKKFNSCGRDGRRVAKAERKTFCNDCSGVGCNDCDPPVNSTVQNPETKQRSWPFPEPE